MQIPAIVGAGLAVLGVGIGIGQIGGKLWKPGLVNQRCTVNFKQRCLLQQHLLKESVLLHYLQYNLFNQSVCGWQAD